MITEPDFETMTNFGWCVYESLPQILNFSSLEFYTYKK